ncbi:MAG: hypothetical protein LC754_19015 [Acidobacteria bacterium]|nr:hypothetical protein [Acidobacteriota bacterium]
MTARTRFHLSICTLVLALVTASWPLSPAVHAQNAAEREFRPDVRRALASRQAPAKLPTRDGAYQPQRVENPEAATLARPLPSVQNSARRTPQPAPRRKNNASTSGANVNVVSLPRVSVGTPLSRVLHTSQLSLANSSGTHEEYVDQSGNFVADERTTFDARGGSYDIAVGRSGTRYEVFTAIDDRGTATTADDVDTGVLVVGLDTNGDYVRDSSSTFDLGRDFGLPSAVSVVTGTSVAGREFVIVSSSGFFNSQDSHDPKNEPSPGVVLLVRDSSTGGFDNSLSRSLLRVGDNRIFNANALTLLPNNNLVIADFQSNELRIVRDTNGDRIPDMLDPVPFYQFKFSDDAPLDIAANSRGVIFSHSAGNSTPLLAVYDDNNDGFADRDEVVVSGLSIDNNLVLHGLTVERDGSVYIVEDAMGANDLPADGGNGGVPQIDAFPDPALNGFLRDGAIFAESDNPNTLALSGLSFGVETVLAPVGHLTLTNSASLQGAATSDGLATIQGASLTRGASGATQDEATTRGLSVNIEGVSVPVLSFSDTQIHVHVPKSLGAGVGSVVVYLNGNALAADDASIASTNPGLFTIPQSGAGETVALLVSGNRYTRGPFPSKFDNKSSVVALFGTGWRNSLPVAVTVGGKPANVSYAGKSGGFPGLDQLNIAIPDGISGAATVIVTTASGATSRSDAFITIQ